MSRRRRTTIHDAAALRLHPNGVRVPLVSSEVRNPESSVITGKYKNPSLARRDARGNWIAMDAGGDGRLTKRRKLGKKEKKVRGEAGEDLEAEGEEDAEKDREEGVPAFKDPRANRRVAFKNDFGFLAEPIMHGGANPTLQPSSDFLKCIHHFASRHYASNGQLFDSAAQYRNEKKEKRRQRIIQAEASKSQDHGRGAVVEESHTEAEEDSMDELSQRIKPKDKGKGKAKVTRTKVTQRDMYKAFEGSALLCIGMLLQSHIVLSLPETWISDAGEDDVITDGVESVGVPSEMDVSGSFVEFISANT